MTILCDSQIKELCTLPTFVITTNVPQPSRGFAFTLPKPVESFSYLSEDEIKASIAANFSNGMSRTEMITGIVDYRLLTEEEINNFKPMISPFVNGQVRVDDNGNKVISYGLSSFGYDIRVSNEFKIFNNIHNVIIDPKNFNEKAYVDFLGDSCIIPPHSFILARSVERFVIPRDVITIVLNKSTYARCGINCLASPLESEWEGYVTLEYSNNTSLPAKIYANEGACQVLFLKGDIPCEVSYADRKGKYQSQPASVVTPKV